MRKSFLLVGMMSASVLTGYASPSAAIKSVVGGDLLVTPNYQLVDPKTLTPVVPTLQGATVVPDKLFTEPQQTVLMRLSVKPSGSTPVILDRSPISNLPSQFQDVTDTLPVLPADACPEDGATAVPNNGCNLYLQYTGPAKFEADQMWNDADMAVHYTEDRVANAAPFSLKTSTTLLYVLGATLPFPLNPLFLVPSGGIVLALSPEDGEVVQQHSNLNQSEYFVAGTFTIDPETGNYYIGSYLPQAPRPALPSFSEYLSCSIFSNQVCDSKVLPFPETPLSPTDPLVFDIGEKFSFGYLHNNPAIYFSTGLRFSGVVPAFVITNPSSSSPTVSELPNQQITQASSYPENISSFTYKNDPFLAVIYSDVYSGSIPSFGSYSLSSLSGVENVGELTNSDWNVAVNPDAPIDSQILITSVNGVQGGGLDSAMSGAPHFTTYFGGEANCFDDALSANTSEGRYFQIYATRGERCASEYTRKIYLGNLSDPALDKTFDLSPYLISTVQILFVQDGVVIG